MQMFSHSRTCITKQDVTAFSGNEGFIYITASELVTNLFCRMTLFKRSAEKKHGISEKKQLLFSA
jgi:hypothetical protein